ncbi:MAG: ATP-binding protein [Polyangia bacterium]|nr:ATP-binding protein [Polyangia bacterium]
MKRLFGQYPVVTVTGPRQSGKTTLVKSVFADLPYVNLEDLQTRELAESDPVGLLRGLRGGAVIDEIQRVPSLLSQIQVLVDEDGRDGLFVLTGSSQLQLMESLSQSLAGRTALLKLLPLSVAELDEAQIRLGADELMFRGFYPRLHDRGLDPTQLYGDYLETYIERDLRSFAQVRNLSQFQRFIRLCAGRVGQLLNASSLANDTGVSSTTIKHWLSLLEASFLVFLLQPFSTNTRRRLVRSPKLYFYDVGLASYLLGVEDVSQLATHPLRGGIFENLVVLEVLKHRMHRGLRVQASFFRDATGNEVDLLVALGQQLLPIEIKSSRTVSTAFFKAFDVLEKTIQGGLARPLVVYAGDREEERTSVDLTHIHGLGAMLRGRGL